MSVIKKQKTIDHRQPDPFQLHFENTKDLDDLLADESSKLASEFKTIDCLGKCKYEFNQQILDKLNRPQVPSNHIKQRILDNLADLTALQKSILDVICSYRDLQFNECTNDNRTEIVQAYSLHALNHVLKTRARVISNNQRIRKEPDTECKDQGFTRPKVLILLPFRNSAYHVIDGIVQLFTGTRKLNYFDKELPTAKTDASSDDDQLDEDLLEEDVNAEENKEDEDLLEDVDSEENKEEEDEPTESSRSKITVMNFRKFKSEFLKPTQVAFKKPDDHKQTFDGNTDEYFRIGIEFTKRSCKLYSRFYSSDIIVASPLGLRTILGAEGEKRRDFDFLSSIELLIMDQAELFQMQNWEHVIHLMKNMNLQPTDHHNTDFSRIRLWSLNGLSKYYRQTLVFSSIKSIYISSLFSRETFNFEGRLLQINLENKLQRANPVLAKQVSLKTVEHRFQRFSTPNNSLSNSADARFKFFTETILPKFNSSALGHTLVYIPSYFDFLRLRNYMRKEEISFTSICEHTERGKMAQARKRFFTNQRTFLLYTERAHFYNRFSIKGIHQLVFYQLPTFPHYYTELSNLLVEQNQRKDFVDDGKTFNVTSIYDQFDRLLLSQILGLDRTNEMMNLFTSLSIL